MTEQEGQADFASVCLLSYNRTEFIEEAILTLTGNANFPLELIVHDDGSDEDTIAMLRRFVDSGAISTLIENPRGHNQGVGNAVRRMFDMAQGDPIIKVDQDLLFAQGWLETLVGVLRRNRHSTQFVATEEEKRIGALGCFRYDYDPVDHAKMFIRSHAYWHEVEDFVGSLFAVPRDVYEEHGPFPTHSDAFAEDVEFKTKLQQEGLALGLTVEDYVHNRGFGLGPSTVAIPDEHGDPTSATIHHGPHLLEASHG